RPFQPVTLVLRSVSGRFAPPRALPGGGVLDVLIEFIAPRPEAAAHLAAIEQALAGRELVSRQVQLGGVQREIGPATMGASRVQVDGERISIRMGAVSRVLPAGLSPAAEFCARFAVALGSAVIGCDPRGEGASGLSVPGCAVRAG
ncbi:XdhC family protein, partial [Pseudomonas syringae]